MAFIQKRRSCCQAQQEGYTFVPAVFFSVIFPCYLFKEIEPAAARSENLSKAAYLLSFAFSVLPLQRSFPVIFPGRSLLVSILEPHSFFYAGIVIETSHLLAAFFSDAVSLSKPFFFCRLLRHRSDAVSIQIPPCIFSILLNGCCLHQAAAEISW